MENRKLFNGYWMGYQPDGNDLSNIPNGVNTVTLFVAAPGQDGKSLDTSYLCKVYSKEDQIRWARALQSRGVEVLMSFMDTPSIQWNKVNIPAFVKNIKEQVIDGEWGLNGVDIDLESGMPDHDFGPIFTDLIEEFRAVLGPKGQHSQEGKANSRISVAAYRPDKEKPILERTGEELDWLNTMAYGQGAEDNEIMFRTYKKYCDQVNMGFGVYYQYGSSTPVTEVERMAAFANLTPGCGMMEFALNNDCKYYTKEAQWTWTKAVLDAVNV